MLNLSVIRQLLPEEKYATLESALAFLQDVAQPDITNNDVSETMDAKHFNTVQRDIVSALNVLFTEIDAVEVILKQAANRTDSGLAEMVAKLDVLYQKTNEAKASLDNREAPLLNIEISKQTLNNDKELYGTYDIAEINDFGLTTQRAGRILQSSYSGIPAATVNVNTYSINTYAENGTPIATEIPCRLGIPANSEPYPKPMSVILNENNSTFWSETILSESVLQIEPNAGHWLYGTDYISGAAVQLVFDFETATRISQLEIVPFAPMPLTFLEVKAGADIVWKNSTGRIVENSGKYILFVENDNGSPVISKKFTLTIAQPHCRQIEYGISQQNEQDLKYWQETAAATYPDDISVYNTDQFNSVVQSSMYNNDSIYTISDTVNNWNTWTENFPQMLASKGIVLPAEQYSTVRGIGAKFGQISELLSTLATPTSNITKKVLRYEYIYGFRQVNFVYEEYNKTGRFISDQLELDGELRQVKAVLTTNPEDSEITQIHDGEIEITASFVGFSNVLSVGNNLALPSMKGMKCYLSERKSTIFEIVDVDPVDDTLTLDKSQKSAFPDELISLQNKTWYIYTEDTKKNAEKNITLKLSLKDSELSNPLSIDDNSWTFIETQTEKPLVVQNPYRMATMSNGDMFVVYEESSTKNVMYCTVSGVEYDLEKPAGFTIFDIFITEEDNLFVTGYDSGLNLQIWELLEFFDSGTDNLKSSTIWTNVTPSGYNSSSITLATEDLDSTLTIISGTDYIGTASTDLEVEVISGAVADSSVSFANDVITITLGTTPANNTAALLLPKLTALGTAIVGQTSSYVGPGKIALLTKAHFSYSTSRTKVWHTALKPGISNYTSNSIANIILTHKNVTEYGIDKLSRAYDSAKGTQFSYVPVPFSSLTNLFPFVITNVVCSIEDGTEYFYIAKSSTTDSIDSQYRNGVYRCTLTEMDYRPIFYSANVSTFEAFDFVKVEQSGSGYSVFGVTSTGKVIEAVVAPLPEYTLLSKYSFRDSTSWDSNSLNCGLTSAINGTEDLLYVADQENNCIKVFIIEEENVLTYKGWIGYGENVENNGYTGLHLSEDTSLVPRANNIPGAFDSPEYLTVDADGNLLVSDTGNNRIQKIRPDGVPIYWLGEDEAANQIIHNNEFKKFEVAVIDNNDNIGAQTGYSDYNPDLVRNWDAATMLPGKWYALNDYHYMDTAINNKGVSVRKPDNCQYVYAEIVCNSDRENGWITTSLFVVQKLRQKIKARELTKVSIPFATFSRWTPSAATLTFGNNWDGSSYGFSSDVISASILGTQGNYVLWNVNIDISALSDPDVYIEYAGIYITGLIQGGTEGHEPRNHWSATSVIPWTNSGYEYAVGCYIGNIETTEAIENLIDAFPKASTAVYGFDAPKGIAVSRFNHHEVDNNPTSNYYDEVISVADYNNDRVQNIPIKTFEQSKKAMLSNNADATGLTVNTSVTLVEPTALTVTQPVYGEIPYVYTALKDKHIVTRFTLMEDTNRAIAIIGPPEDPILIVAGSSYTGILGNDLKVKLDVSGYEAIVPSVSFDSNTKTLTITVSHSSSWVHSSVTAVITALNSFAITDTQLKIYGATGLRNKLGLGPINSSTSSITESIPVVNFELQSETLGYNQDNSGAYRTYGLPSTSGDYAHYTTYEGNGGFNEPYGVFVKNNRLHVIDRTGRIQIYNTSFGSQDELQPQLTFGSVGAQDNQTVTPVSLYIDHNNNMFVSDQGNSRIKKYSTTNSYTWNTSTISDEAIALIGIEIITNRLGENLKLYLCQSDGHVYSYSLYNEEWRRTNCDYIIGGIKAICTENEFSGNKSLYAISTLGTIYKALPNGQWQWLRSAVEKSVLNPSKITESFAKTDTTGKIKLSEWPYIDFEGINNYYNNNNNSQHYNPNNIMIPTQNPFEIEVLLKDGTKAIPDTTGVPFQATGRKIFQTIPSSVNSLSLNETLAAVSPYIMSPVTVVDEETLGNYTDQLADSNVNFKRGQTSLTFSRVVGRRIFKSRYKDWSPDPSFKIGILAKDIDGNEKLYYKGSSTHKVMNLPIPNIIPKEGLIVFREDLPQYFELQEPGDSSVRLVEAFDDELKIVVFDFFATDYVIVQRNNDGTISRDTNGEYIYLPLQTRSVPYTTNCTDYLRGLSPDVSKTPYNASVPINDPLYNPVIMYTHNGREIMFNSVLTENDVQSITIKYNSLELRPRLIVDMNRTDYPVTKTPIIESCNLLIGRINP